MAMSILDTVLMRLRQAKFKIGIAYPGQKYPTVTEPLATVHIQKVDQRELTVTVEVNIICPAAMGGTACELEALRATEILRLSQAVCVQNGCTYDGISQVYVVSVLATFVGTTEVRECMIWPGFGCLINGVDHIHVVRFHTEEDTGLEPVYAVGEKHPVAFSGKEGQYRFEIEELIPVGSTELPGSDEAFTVDVWTELKIEHWEQCRWLSVSREYTRQGLRRIRKGVALSKWEEPYG